ncbi:MAG: hypothetical protein AB7I30_03025, partial [Isosphaeraceae bacterium]
MIRQGWLRFPLAFLTLGAIATHSATADEKDSRWTLRVQETAGLRRFGYPVHARLPEGILGPRFRLERDGKAVPGQFRKVEVEGSPPHVALDFNTSLGPLETQEFVVEAGPHVTPGPEPKGGMTVSLNRGAFLVSNGSVLSYEVPENLDGVFRSVQNVRLEFWRPEGRGLFVKSSRGKLVKLGGDGPIQGRVSRSGPFAVGLRFQGE